MTKVKREMMPLRCLTNQPMRRGYRAGFVGGVRALTQSLVEGWRRAVRASRSNPREMGLGEARGGPASRLRAQSETRRAGRSRAGADAARGPRAGGGGAIGAPRFDEAAAKRGARPSSSRGALARAPWRAGGGGSGSVRSHSPSPPVAPSSLRALSQAMKPPISSPRIVSPAVVPARNQPSHGTVKA